MTTQAEVEQLRAQLKTLKGAVAHRQQTADELREEYLSACGSLAEMLDGVQPLYAERPDVLAASRRIIQLRTQLERVS